MRTRQIGKLAFEASEVAFGGASVSGEGKGYGFGYISEEDAIALLRASYDRGINLFDTAPVYGYGLSEIRFGKAFKDIRERVFIVSKCGITWHDNGRINLTNDPRTAVAMLERSLEDLQTDYIDLYMVHWPDPGVDIRVTVEALSDAQRRGKIRHIGLCNTHLEDLKKAMEVARIEAVQSEFNLFTATARDELFPFLEQNQIGFMSWGTFDKGILTQRVRRGRTYDMLDARRKAPWWNKSTVDRKVQAMEKVSRVLGDHSGLEAALGFVLSYKTVSTALCGIRSLSQLDSLIRALARLPGEPLLQQAHRVAQDSLEG